MSDPQTIQAVITSPDDLIGTDRIQKVAFFNADGTPWDGSGIVPADVSDQLTAIQAALTALDARITALEGAGGGSVGDPPTIYPDLGAGSSPTVVVLSGGTAEGFTVDITIGSSPAGTSPLWVADMSTAFPDGFVAVVGFPSSGPTAPAQAWYQSDGTYLLSIYAPDVGEGDTVRACIQASPAVAP